MRHAILSAALLTLAACGGPAAKKVEVVDDTGTRITMTLIPDSASAYTAGHTAYIALSQKWLDAYVLAGATPRISLPPVIASMQALRREMDALPLPACMAQAKRFRLAAMDRQIAELTAFLSMTQSESGNLDRANALVQSATTVIDACKP